MFFFTLLIWAVVTVVAELVRPKPNFENAKPASLGDFKFPTATEGRAVPLIWGRVKVSGPNNVWYGNYRKVAKKQNVKTGMFSSEDIITGYRYYVGMQFALCRGPVDFLHGIWLNDKPIASTSSNPGSSTAVNAPTLFGGEEHGTGGIVGGLFFYGGDQVQTPNSYLSNYQTPTPAYRGICYAVFTNSTGTNSGWIGNSTNVAPWAFDIRRIPDGLNMASADPGAEAPNTYDANPANVLYEILTDTSWGLSIPASLIDVPNFQGIASTLADEGNGFSMVLDSEMQVTDLIAEIQRQIDGSLFFNRGTGQWQIQLARADYDPGTLDIFDESAIISLNEFTRQTWEETSNQVRVAFTDRSDQYKDTFALAQDGGNISIQGYSISSDISYPGVKDKDLANSIAWRELRGLSYPVAKISFTVDRTAFNLVPGSVFKFSWARLGISEVVFRVGSINYGKPGSSQIEIFAVQDVFATEVGGFSAPVGTGWQEPEDAGVPVTSINTLVLEAPRQMVLQDPFSPILQTRVWMGARFPGGGTITLRAYLKAGPSRPISNPYLEDTSIAAFVLTGTLVSALNDYSSTVSRPDTSYNIDVDHVDELSPVELQGNVASVQELLNIAYIDGEYIGFERAADTGSGNVLRLNYVYRGLFHTAPKNHAAGTTIWFLGQGGNLSRYSLLSNYDEIDLQLRSQDAAGAETTELETPVEAVTLDYIYEMPLAPRDPYLNGAYTPTSGSLDLSYTTETGRTGEDARALEIEITPRDWRVPDPVGDTTLTAGYLTDYSPEFDFTLILDPTGTPINVGPYNISGTTTPTAYVLRNDVIIAVGANTAIPTSGRVSVEASHTVGINTRVNPVTMDFDFTVASTLIGSALIHGGVDDGTSPAAVTYNETGTYTFNIYAALPSSGTLEARINGGSWVTVVAAAATSGTLAVTATDSVELRHTQPPAADQFFSVAGPTSETGYGALLA